MRRISVIGSSGSGKSTVARELSCALAAPFLELDSVFHQADWVPLPESEFRRRIAEIAAGDAWVIDGNYSSVLPLVWERADTVVWLDLPRRVVMRRIVLRTLRRAALRTELWNGNHERLAGFFSRDPEKSLIVWVWQKHPVYRQRYESAMTDPAYSHIRFVRLRSPRDVRRYLAGSDAGSLGA